jgi:N-acetylglucosaminyldiphosphoundecaprenol N-acetyl-beta-D-mannosaminyltransferase
LRLLLQFLKSSCAMALESVNLFGIDLHRVTLRETVLLLLEWMSQDAACRYVVTPNVDHIVKLQTHPAMRDAYQDAALIVADGWPLVAASRWLGQPLPERVAGSDLVPGLFAAGGSIADMRVFLLGAAPGVAAIAAERIHARWPGVRVCGVASPPPGFEVDADQSGRIVDEINSTSPHLLVVGLGAPKQEIWLKQNAPKLEVPVAIAAGATIDFLAGVQNRAPVWIQLLRLEWFYRLMSDPKRLAGRYARDAIVFPRLVAAEWRRQRAEARRQPCGTSKARLHP